MLGVVVKGGTQAGRRIIRQPALNWQHECLPATLIREDGSRVEMPTTLYLKAADTRCPRCGTKRP